MHNPRRSIQWHQLLNAQSLLFLSPLKIFLILCLIYSYSFGHFPLSFSGGLYLSAFLCAARLELSWIGPSIFLILVSSRVCLIHELFHAIVISAFIFLHHQVRFGGVVIEIGSSPLLKERWRLSFCSRVWVCLEFCCRNGMPAIIRSSANFTNYAGGLIVASGWVKLVWQVDEDWKVDCRKSASGPGWSAHQDLSFLASTHGCSGLNSWQWADHINRLEFDPKSYLKNLKHEPDVCWWLGGWCFYDLPSTYLPFIPVQSCIGPESEAMKDGKRDANYDQVIKTPWYHTLSSSLSSCCLPSQWNQYLTFVQFD